MCKDLIILLMCQINFIRDLIGEKLSLEAQSRLNREIRILNYQNSIFTKLID
jgi:hypothetical protein